MLNFYIKKKNGKFIDQSLCWLGIVYNSYNFEIVTDFNKPVKPYVCITEGVIGDIDFIKLARHRINLKGYDSNGELMFESIFHDDNSLKIVSKGVFNLYHNNDYKNVENLIKELENNKDKNIFLFNTEPIINIYDKKINQIAGLASGTFISEISYNLDIKNILFFDYSLSSLEYQKNLINNEDRYNVIKNYIENNLLVVGDGINDSNFNEAHGSIRKGNLKDLNLLNLDKINKIYNHLSKCNVEYLHIDLRMNNDIELLFKKLKFNSYLWLSNVYYYPTSINYTNKSIFKLIDTLANKKNIKLLDHTRILYESKNN